MPKVDPPRAKRAVLSATAAALINLGLFAAVTGLNRVVEARVTPTLGDATPIALETLPPLPAPTPPPTDRVEPPRPTTGSSTRPNATTDQSEPAPLDLALPGVGSLELGLHASTARASGPTPLPTPKPTTRVYGARDVDEPARATACDLPPEAPAVMRRRGISGRLRVRAVVDARGNARDLVSAWIDGVEHPTLTELARKHFRSCRFEPAKKDGRSVSQRVTRTYAFTSGA